MSTRRVAALLVTAISLPGWGYSQSLLREHFEITVQHVAQTLSNSGIQIADLRVSLLAKVGRPRRIRNWMCCRLSRSVCGAPKMMPHRVIWSSSVAMRLACVCLSMPSQA